jgi:transcriptional regulator GlxA family with amidase domain
MKRVVAILLFEDVEELDFAGPWEVFAVLRHMEPDLCDVYTVSQAGGTVRCAKGLRVIADHSFQTAPPPHVLIVPGGVGRKREVNNPATIQFIRETAERAERVASVCTGAFLLQRAGLLEGKRATTYWMAIDELRGLGTDAIAGERFVDQGKVLTAAGVSAGIDMSLYLVGQLFSPQLARRVQKAIEYEPHPPYTDVPLPDRL